MTKKELKELIRECLQEELHSMKETFNVKDSDGHFSIVQFAKNIHDNLVANKVDCVVSLVDGYKVKIECDNFDGVDDLVRNTKELVANNMEPDIEDKGSYRLYMLKQKAVQESAANVEDTDDVALAESFFDNIFENLY